MNLGVVHVNSVIGGVEEVAQQCHGSCLLLIDELRGLCGLLYTGNHVLPSAQQRLKFLIKLGSALAFSHGADDDAKILGLHALHQLLESRALFAALNFA